MREGIYIIDIFPHTRLLKNLKFYPYRPLKPLRSSRLVVNKIRYQSIELLRSESYEKSVKWFENREHNKANENLIKKMTT